MTREHGHKHEWYGMNWRLAGQSLAAGLIVWGALLILVSTI